MQFCFHKRHDGSIALFELRGSTAPLVHLVPDGHWPGMSRILMPDGSLSDMTNKSRAKYAALHAAEFVLAKRRGKAATA
jgi:hypothetical protein